MSRFLSQLTESEAENSAKQIVIPSVVRVGVQRFRTAGRYFYNDWFSSLSLPLITKARLSNITELVTILRPREYKGQWGLEHCIWEAPAASGETLNSEP